MKILLTAINAKYIHSNLAIYSLKVYAEKYRKMAEKRLSEKELPEEELSKTELLKEELPKTELPEEELSKTELSEEELPKTELPKEKLPKIAMREFTINHSLDEILEELYQEHPDVLCFSCYIWNITYVKLLIREIKALLPDTDIWLGGPEVSYNAEEFLQEFSEPEGILYGEGERVFTNLCNYYADIGNTRCHIRRELKRGKAAEVSFNKIMNLNGKISLNGIIYREEEWNGEHKNKIICNPPEPPVDLSEIPFPYADLQIQENGTKQLIPNALIKDLEHRIIYYESSRGCPFSCSYCLSSVEKYLRFRDLESVKKELQFFLDYKVKQVKFTDRTFNCKKSHALSIWKYLLEHDNGITNFHFEIGADLLDEEELVLLKKMRPGLIQLEIGVQSTNEKTIQEINRTMKLSDLERAVAKIRRFENINLHLDLIAGLPYEDLKIFRKSFNDVYYMQPHQLQLGFLKVLKGSAVAEKKESYGMVHKNFPPYEILYTKWMSFDDMMILKGMESMIEKYYNSGQFTYSLKFFEQFFEDSFELYYELAEYEKEHFKKSEKHARIDLYYILLDFYRSRKNDDKKEKLFMEILTFDIYLRENMKTRPTFALDVLPYKKLFRGISESFRERTTGHIEIFSEEAWKILHDVKSKLYSEKWEQIFVKLKSGFENQQKKRLVYFDYTKRNPLNHNAQVYEVIIEEQNIF